MQTVRDTIPEPITERLRACVVFLGQRHPIQASELATVLDRLETMLRLTRTGDCLFADEIRNLLDMPHKIRTTRGMASDPLRNKRNTRTRDPKKR